MSKAKDAAFYRTLRDHLLKLVEYVLVLEKRTTNLSDEFCCLKENLRHIEHKLNSYLNYKQLTAYLKQIKEEDENR